MPKSLKNVYLKWKLDEYQAPQNHVITLFDKIKVIQQKSESQKVPFCEFSAERVLKNLNVQMAPSESESVKLMMEEG